MTYVIPEVHRYAARGGSSQGPRQLAPNIGEDRMCSFYLNGGAENASTGKRKYGKGKYETAHFARMENSCRPTENASTENASTMQT